MNSLAGGTLIVINCTARNFMSDGLHAVLSSEGGTLLDVIVQDSHFSGNGTGIIVVAGNALSMVRATVLRSTVVANVRGINFGGGGVIADLTGIEVSHNSSEGLHSQGASTIRIRNSEFAYSAPDVLIDAGNTGMTSWDHSLVGTITNNGSAASDQTNFIGQVFGNAVSVYTPN